MINVEVTNTPDQLAPFYCELSELCEMNELDYGEVLAALQSHWAPMSSRRIERRGGALYRQDRLTADASDGHRHPAPPFKWSTRRCAAWRLLALAALLIAYYTAS